MTQQGLLPGIVAAAMSVMGATVGHAQGASAPPFQIVEATIDDIHAAYRSGRLTARQLVQGYLDRIKAYDKAGPNINSILTHQPARAGGSRPARRRLQGLRLRRPAARHSGRGQGRGRHRRHADNHGTVVFKDYRPTRDAFAIDLLRKAGAIILGKTTLSEYSAGDTYGSMFGITRNPYDLERTVGGSSGGSAGALAANLATVAIGEETLASIRRPAAWNAVVALRPTPGLVSRSGMWDGHPSPVAQMGPMARTVKDLAILLDGMVGYDPEDPSTALGIGQHPASYARALDANALKGARIGILRELIGDRDRHDVGGFQEGRRRLREEHRGAEGRRRRHRRSDRDPGPQEATRHARRAIRS